MEVSWLHLILLLPLLGAAICGLGGKWLPKAWLYAVALVGVLLSFCIGVYAFFHLGEETQLFHELAWNWFSAGSLHVDMSFMLDRLSGAMVLVITGVGFLIHVYSVGYIDDDPGYWRYFAYLILLVQATGALDWNGIAHGAWNLVSAGDARVSVWPLGHGHYTGVLSFLEPGYFQSHHTPILQSIAPATPKTISAATAVGLALLLGCTGKSAQIPLYVWLPDAMAGPTPVSALIHAATMVTAGVYMVARLSHLYVAAPGVMAVVAVIGALTAIWAALIGTSQNDIKKVLAYSTVSQLGYMFIGVGVGAFFAGTMHLITHAFFKACLFLGSGAVIHGLHGEQDMTRMGGIRKYMPSTRMTFLIATIAITGIVPISGFFSKDEILAQALHTRAFSFLTAWDPAATNVPLLRPLLLRLSQSHLTWLGPLIYVVGSATAFLTSFYMWRCYFLTFSGEYRGPAEVHPHEAPPVMTLPLWILAALSVLGLVLGLPAQWVHGTFLEHWTWERVSEGLFATTRGDRPEAFSPWLGYGIALIVGWAGWAVSYALYYKRGLAGDEALTARIGSLRRALVNKLYVDELYGFAIVRPLWALARGLWRIVDKTIIDGLFVNGVPRLIAWFSRVARFFQNGNVQRYAAVTAVGVAALVWVFLVRNT